MTEPMLIPDVDTPAAPATTHASPSAKRPSITWRFIFRQHCERFVGSYMATFNKPPLEKLVKDQFKAHFLEHLWPDGSPIKNRRRVWNQEARRAVAIVRDGKIPEIVKAAKGE